MTENPLTAAALDPFRPQDRRSGIAGAYAAAIAAFAAPPPVPAVRPVVAA